MISQRKRRLQLRWERQPIIFPTKLRENKKIWDQGVMWNYQYLPKTFLFLEMGH